MRHYRHEKLTIPAGEQDSNAIAVNAMTMVQTIYSPEDVLGNAVVQCQTFDTPWCDVEDVFLGKASCAALPLVACSSLRVHSDMVQDTEQVFVYAYLFQE